MSTLLESNFLTIDLSAITKQTKTNTNTETEDKPAQDNVAQDLKSISDWGAEYKKRISDNNKLDAESRVDEAELNQKFFTEYFNANWDTTAAQQLLNIGEILVTVFKVLGFKKETNPILAFISDDYVINNLIKTKLLNAVTFKAIYNSVANKWIADKEYFAANDYNIIYCADFYKKSVSEMVEYLKNQNKYLAPGKSPYEKGMQESNKKVFFNITDISENDLEKRKKAIKSFTGNLPSAMDDATTLNSLELVKKVVGIAETADKSGDNAHMSEADMSAKVAKLTTIQAKYAALVFLGVAYNSKDAQKALRNSRFAGITNSEVAAASAEIQELFNKSRYPAAEIKELVAKIVESIS